jgi:hypothetical protein
MTPAAILYGVPFQLAGHLYICRRSSENMDRGGGITLTKDHTVTFCGFDYRTF